MTRTDDDDDDESQKVKTIVKKWVTMKHLIHEHREATVLIRVKGTVSSPNIFQSIINSVFNWHTKHALTAAVEDTPTQCYRNYCKHNAGHTHSPHL